MFTTEQLKSQQKILRDAGLYTGPIDGLWSQECENAMKGFAIKSPAGNTNGKPFDGRLIPDGWKLLSNGCYKKDKPAAPIAPDSTGDSTNETENGATPEEPAVTDSGKPNVESAPSTDGKGLKVSAPTSFTVTK